MEASSARTVRPVRLGDVSRLAQEGRVSMTAADRLLHKGPYPLYAENCSASGIDDYALEAGGTVVVGAFGQVISNTGFLMAVHEPGRCSVLSNSSKAAHLVAGTSHLRQLAGTALMTVPIPWPEREVREAFVAELDGLEGRIAELGALVPELLRQGDEAFRELVCSAGEGPEAQALVGEVARWHEGTDVPAAQRGAEKPVRVEGPRGKLGRCDDALTQGPAVVVGPSGRRLLAHYVGEPAHPIAEMRYAEASDSSVSLPVLLFALRAAGMPDRLRSDGRTVEAPLLSPDDFEAIRLWVGTPEARDAFTLLAADLLEQVVAAEREIDELTAARHEVADAFVNRGVYRGETLGQAEPTVPAAEEMSEVPGDSTSPLGALAPVACDTHGLDPADFAWELAPLAVVRALTAPERWAEIVAAADVQEAPEHPRLVGALDAAMAALAEEDDLLSFLPNLSYERWAEIVAAADVQEAPEHPRLVGALDAAMAALAEEDDLLSFLPNLSYGSSLLAPEQLAALVRSLDGIGAQDITGDAVRAAFALEPAADAALPPAVAHILSEVLTGVAEGLPAGWETAYVPFEAHSGVVDLFGRQFPAVTLRAQFEEFAPMLQAAMVRAVDLGSLRDERGGLGAAAGSALTCDEFSDWEAPLVAAVLPPNPGPWCDGAVQKDDPRWLALGVPPRNKANYAWIQHALSHQGAGGSTVLLVANGVLHSTSGSERDLRESLAASGRVRLVASLPARIYADGRPASSLIVLGDPVSPDEPAGCLMVDALGLAEPCGGPDAPERVLPQEAATRVAAVCRAWLAGEPVVDEPGFARVVDRRELIDNEGLLTPWTYA